MEEMIREVRGQILDRLDVDRDLSDEDLKAKIQDQVHRYGNLHALTLEQMEHLQKQVFNSFRRLDRLQPLLENKEITEIMVNGTEEIYCEIHGALRPWGSSFETKEQLENVVQQIAALGNRSVNEAEPILDTRLPDGSRVNVVLPPVAVDGPYITIRKFFRDYMSLGKLEQTGTLSEEMRQLFELLVKTGYNIFISGGTGSGKTTFLNALSGAIPKEERVITIEDSAELQMQDLPNVVRLEARMANVNGAGAITIRDLIKTSLRMRPERIIVGEVRGPEALELLQANNTGHSGSLSTGHANSCRDVISRLETMVLMGYEISLPAIRSQIASGIDILIHMGRTRGGERKVLEVCEVVGMKDGHVQIHPLYEYREAYCDEKKQFLGEWQRKGVLKCRQRLERCRSENCLERIYGDACQRELPGSDKEDKSQ